jgi:hypothetical protein
MSLRALGGSIKALFSVIALGVGATGVAIVAIFDAKKVKRWVFPGAS